MTKLNFKQFKIPTGIAKEHFHVGDARESVANMLYLNCNGVRAHALAMKIYKSEGEAEYSEEEIESLKEVSSRFGTPAFIDALNDLLENQTNPS